MYAGLCKPREMALAQLACAQVYVCMGTRKRCWEGKAWFMVALASLKERRIRFFGKINRNYIGKTQPAWTP